MAKFLYILLLTLIGAYTGLFLAPYFIPKDAGLAGGAIVFWYGVFGLLLGFGAGFLSGNRLSKRQLVTGNIVLGLFFLCAICWQVYRINIMGGNTQ